MSLSHSLAKSALYYLSRYVGGTSYSRRGQVSFSTRIVKAHEPISSQPLRAELAIAAFNEARICRVTWVRKVERDARVTGPDAMSFEMKSEPSSTQILDG